MTKRIFHSICLVALAVLLSCLVLVMGVLYNYFTRVQESQLRIETTLAAQAVANEGISYFDGLDAASCRITWIDSDGTVLYDSESDYHTMENHLEREEIVEALSVGIGESARYSTTLLERYIYCAKRLPDGTVVRLSTEQTTVLTLVLGMAQPIALVFLVAVGLSLWLASRLAKRVVKPLNELNLDAPMENEGYEELSPLLRRIDSQQRQLRLQSDKVRRKQDEFETVTGCMSEGLVLLGSKGQIITMNHAATRLLDARWYCKGDDFLTINRVFDIRQAVTAALDGTPTEKIVHLTAGDYQLNATPVQSDGAVSGVVLLLIDVTEKQRIEQQRREFTANVSHELKTPLQSISGYAELLSRGIARPEDTQTFAEKIYIEAQRMIQLVEDIIRLSRLDEGAENMCREQLDLYEVAEEAVADLMVQGARAGVSVKLQGSHVTLCGIRQLIAGIVTNLCENGIKYNRPGGTVEISVTDAGAEAVLTVRDTGIGIPAEHQNRVFERFYRVDKSHSKEVGGTGLGLSIVKHAAKVHDAKITLDSEVGKGTTVSVRFPK